MVTIEVPTDRGTRHRPVDADEEILNTCDELRDLAAGEVTLITGDTAMRLRAEVRGIRVVRMPDQYERRRSDDGGPPQDR